MHELEITDFEFHAESIVFCGFVECVQGMGLGGGEWRDTFVALCGADELRSEAKRKLSPTSHTADAIT